MKKLILTSEKTSHKSLSSLYIYRNAITRLFLLAFCFIGVSMLAKGQDNYINNGSEFIGIRITPVSVGYVEDFESYKEYIQSQLINPQQLWCLARSFR